MELDGGGGVFGMVESQEEGLWVDDVLGDRTDELPEGGLPRSRREEMGVRTAWAESSGDGLADLDCLGAIDADDGECRLESDWGGWAIDRIRMGAEPDRAGEGGRRAEGASE
jgi:hypothetical protein